METSTKIRAVVFLFATGLLAWVLLPVYFIWQETGKAPQDALSTWQFFAGGLLLFFSIYSGKFFKYKKKRYHDASGDSMSKANVMLGDDDE